MQLVFVSGCTWEFDVSLKNQDGTEYVLEEGDKLSFCANKIVGSYPCSICITQNSTHFKIPTDQTNIPEGTYYYDLFIIFENGDKYPLFSQERLVVREEVCGDAT